MSWFFFFLKRGKKKRENSHGVSITGKQMNECELQAVSVDIWGGGGGGRDNSSSPTACVPS